MPTFHAFLRPFIPHLLVLLSPLTAVAANLQVGPMLGYASMAEVLILVQTDEPAEVRIDYWPEGQPSQRFWTDTIRTEKRTGFVARCLADQVKAGTRYAYRVYIDGMPVDPEFREGYREGTIPLHFETPRNWRFREEGHAIFDFSVGFGSCAYINEEGGYDRLNGRPYGDAYQIFEKIYEVDPDVFIWLGDNVYYREPDWTSRTGMIHRWTHDRSIPELRPFLANIPSYAIWDDHDYGPNDIGRDFWHKKLATEVFGIFNGNPTAGLPELPGIFSYFAWGDVHFYLLDNRTYRTVAKLNPEPFGYEEQQLGKAQIDWLVESMKQNRNQSESSYPCTFHVVAIGNQVLSPFPGDSLQRWEKEWQYLFDRLVAEEIHNVIFISGDVHFAEVSRMEYKGMAFWDVTSSPLTAGPWAGSDASDNPYRVDVFPGEPDRYPDRNFATLSFEGPLTQRRAVIRYFNSDGALLNQLPGGEPGQVTPESVIESVHPNLSPRLYK